MSGRSGLGSKFAKLSNKYGVMALFLGHLLSNFLQSLYNSSY